MLARLLAVLLLAAPASAVARPNIVVIMSDDQPDIETLETMPTLRREMSRFFVVLSVAGVVPDRIVGA
jgi:hypothetical protein